MNIAGVWQSIRKARALLEPVGAASASMDAVLLLAVLVMVTITFWTMQAWRTMALRRSRYKARDEVLTALRSVDRAIEEVRLSVPALPYRRAVWRALDRLHAAESAAVSVLGDEVQEHLVPVFRLAGQFMLNLYVEWDANASPEVGDETGRSGGRRGQRLEPHGERENDRYAQEFSAALKSAMDYYRECADPGA